MKVKNLWNNKEIEVVEINGRWFALDGWNGEVFLHCWETDENTFSLGNHTEFEIKPVYKGVGEPDKDGDFEEYEIVAYEIM